MERNGSGQIDMDQLIEERKLEKRKLLREKLQQKLKIIHDRRVSGVNNEPFPEGAFERLRSNNMWEEILCYHTDPTDVTSAYFTCKTFAGILEERRKMMMLPKVLDVLKINADDSFRDDNWELGDQWCENWKLICLSGRGVSKSWREIADVHLFDSDYTKDDWFLNTDGLEFDDPRSNSTVFEDEESADKAMSLLLSHAQTSSCLVRNLHVSVDHFVRDDPIMKITEFLQIHGASVSFFCFQWFGSRNDAVEAYQSLCEMLEVMPKLKGLILRFHIYDRTAVANEAFQNFHRRLNERPFPTLSSLEHLVVDCEIDNFLLFQILRKCVNLRSVNHSECETVTEEVAETLMRLPLERFEGLSSVITTHLVTWPLKFLEISCGMEAIRASLLIPAINRFQETLEHLIIWELVVMDVTNVRWELPNLKSIFIRRGSFGLDDLLPLKSLEKISVESADDEYKNAKVKVKTYLDSGEMRLSNIWQCFPSLRRFKIDSDFSFTYYRPT